MKRKPIMGLGILAVGAVLLITATFAARDLTQHTTSRVRTTIAQDNVILVEKFNPEDALGWKKHDVISKEIFVRNGQDTDDKEKYLYEDAYVRLQIKEYLEFIDYEYTYSDERLMVDAKGDFIKEASRVDLETWMTTNEVPDDARIVELQGYYDTEPSFYIATQQGDVNGEYGVHLIVDRDDTNSQSIVVGQTNQTLKAIERHHDVINDESVYTAHQWSDREYLSYADPTNPITEYIKLGLGNDVITKQEWIASGAQPVKKWILDTDSTEGWVYWGDILTHDNTITNIESITSNFIESVELINTLEGQAEYYNRISLDAISFEDMSMWLDAPGEIFDAFGVIRNNLSGSRKKLEQLVEIIEATDYQQFIQLNYALVNSKNVLANEAATEQEMITSYDTLKALFDKSMSNEEESLQEDLPMLVKLATMIEDEIDLNHFEGFALQEATDFKASLSSARALLVLIDQTGTLGVTAEEIEDEYDALYTAYINVTQIKPSYYQAIRTSLSELIDEASSTVFEDVLGSMRNDFYQALDSAQLVSSDKNSIAKDITDAYDVLGKEFSDLISDENAFYKYNLSILLTEVNAYTFDVELGSLLTPYYDGLNIANSVNGEITPTTVSLKDAYSALKNAFDTLLIDENEYYKNNLPILLVEVSAHTFDAELGSLLTPYNNALNTAISVNNESSPTTASLKDAYYTLRNTFDTLVIDENDFYRGKLNDLIINVQSVTFEQELGTMSDPFYDSLTSANQINSNSSSSTSSIQSALQSLSNTYNTLLTDENEFYKNKLSRLLTEVSSYTFDAELGSLLTPYNNALSTANTLNSESSPTTVSLKNAHNTLKSTYDALVIDENSYFRNSLSDKITQVNGYTFDPELGSLQTPYINALNTANSVKNQSTSTIAAMKDARDTLNSTYNALLTDEKTFYREELTTLINKSNIKVTEKLKTGALTQFNPIFTTSKATYNNSSSTGTQLKDARNTLRTAYNNLRLASDGPIPVGGKILNFAGQDWVVLHEDGEGHALIALDRQLQVDDYTKIGVTPDFFTYGIRISFHQSQTNYFPGGYEASKLKQVDVGFYNAFIKDHVDNDAVLSVEITQEVMIADIAQSKTRTDAPTVINATSGTKTAFSLSVSDMIVYNVQMPRKLMSNVSEYGPIGSQSFNFGLRSPANSDTNRMFSEQHFYDDDHSFKRAALGSRELVEGFTVIPCMWITIGS